MSNWKQFTEQQKNELNVLALKLVEVIRKNSGCIDKEFDRTILNSVANRDVKNASATCKILTDRIKANLK